MTTGWALSVSHECEFGTQNPTGLLYNKIPSLYLLPKIDLHVQENPSDSLTSSPIAAIQSAEDTCGTAYTNAHVSGANSQYNFVIRRAALFILNASET
jgi:hypothetical protein